MRTHSLGVVVAIALGLSLQARTSEAASLSLATTWQFNLNAGVFASDGSNPIPYPGIPAGGGGPTPAADSFASGTMSLDPVGASQAEISFSFSIFSDAHPYIATGSYGSSGIPVELRIDEISYDLAPTLASIGSQWLSGSVTGTMRGSLTVGASVMPFTVPTSAGWYSDGAPLGTIDADVSLDHVVFGFVYGELYSGLGAFPQTDLMTVDGVTFSVGATYPEFWTITYVPEPASTALSAVASLCLFLAHRSRRRLLPGA